MIKLSIDWFEFGNSGMLNGLLTAQSCLDSWRTECDITLLVMGSYSTFKCMSFCLKVTGSSLIFKDAKFDLK